MKYIECPNQYIKKDKSELSLFVAGGITGCSNWQKEYVGLLRDENVVLLNPRREKFPSKPTEAVNSEQITWEFDYLKNSDAVSFWFTQETVCPITLYELGKQVMIDRPVFVGVHPNYTRKEHLEIQLKLIRPEIEIAYNLEDLANQVKTWIKQKQ